MHHFLFLLGLVCENFFWFGWVIISSSSSVFLSLCASYLYPLTLLIQLQFSDYGRDPFNQNSDRSDREKRTTSKGGPVFSKLFRLDRTDPLSFGPKFPEILVEWIAPFVFWENKTVMAFWMLCHVWACLAVILESIAHFIIIILKSELSSLLLYSCFFYKLLNQDLNCFQCTILTFQKNATLNFSWAEPNSN